MLKSSRRLIALVSMTLLVSACQNAQNPAQVNWESGLYLDHPLVGRIWNSSRDIFLPIEDLMSQLANARYLLLGEKHDNPDHHRLQLEILQQLFMQAPIAGVAFEMMDTDQQSVLRDIYQGITGATYIGGHDFSTLKEQINWDEAGWNWEYYSPLLLATLRGHVPALAANISNETMQAVYGQVDNAASSVLGADIVEKLQQDIDASHCGLLPASQFPAMVRVQQARDQQMADSLNLISDSEQGVRVLIAGNYHIRQDLGVPNYLLARNPPLQQSQIVSLALIEVQHGINDPEDYLEAFSDVLPFDFIWFTPAISDEDYCASLRSQ